VPLRHGSARVLGWLEGVPRPAVAAGTVLLVAGIATLDWFTPIQLSLAVFHVIPVFLAAWLLGRRAGLAFAVAAAVSWFLADALHPEVRTALRLLAGTSRQRSSSSSSSASWSVRCEPRGIWSTKRPAPTR
jgi:hypothetical protein